MAKQISTVDTSYLNPEYLRSVAAERLAAGNGSRRAPLVDDDAIVPADESVQTAVELPAFALDPKHVRRMFVRGEISALSILGGRTLRNMPNTARAVMTAKGGKIAGADDGDIAVWDTDPKGIECAKPHLFAPAEWARIWSVVGNASFVGEHHVQELSHAPSFILDEQTGIKTEKVAIVNINGRPTEKRYGFTCTAEVNGTDKFGDPVTLGGKRFFFDVSGYNTLVAPMSPTHVAAGIMQQFWPGLALPRNNEDRLLLAGRVARKMSGGRISLGTLKGNLYMNLPSVKDETIQSLLDESLSVKVILANHEKVRNDLRVARAEMRAADENQPSVAAPVEDYLDAAAPEYALEQTDGM